MFAASSLALLSLMVPVVNSAAPVPSTDLGNLKAVPADAAAFVSLRGIEGVKDRLFGMLQNALPEYAFLAKTIVDGAIANGLDGRKIDGLAKNGPIFIATPDFKEMTEENTNVVIIAAITDYSKFRDGLLKADERKAVKKDGKFDVVTVQVNDNKRTYYMAEKAGFAVLAQTKELANWVLNSKESMDGKITPALGSRVVNSDISVFVNLDQGLKTFADQLKEAETSLNDFLKNAAEALPKEQKASFDILQKMVGPGFQALRDSKATVLGISFQPQGALVRFELEARNGSQTAKFFNGVGSSTLESMGNHTAGQTVYTGFVGSDMLMKLTETFSRGLAGNEGKEEDAKKLTAALEALSKAGPGENNASIDFPMAGLTIQAYKDPKAAMEATTKNLDFLNGGSVYGNGMIKDKVKLTPDAVTHDGIKFTKAEFAWDFEKMFNQGQELPDEIKKQVQNAMKELMGEKVEIYVGISKNNDLISLTAPNWNKAKMIYDSYKAGKDKLSANENFQAVRKGMAERQSLLSVIDPVRYAGKVIDVMKGAFAGMIPFPPGFPANVDKAKPTYIGTGVTMEQNSMALEFYLSSASIQEIHKAFIKPFLGQ